VPVVQSQRVIMVRIRRAAADRWLSAAQWKVTLRRQPGLSTVSQANGDRTGGHRPETSAAIEAR
jgi:hypothetical protein